MGEHEDLIDFDKDKSLKGQLQAKYVIRFSQDDLLTFKQSIRNGLM